MYVHEGTARTVVNEYGVASFAEEVVCHLKRTPHRVVGTVKIEKYYYISKATPAIAKAVCLEVPQLERAIAAGMTCVWELSDPDRFGRPPLSRQIGKKKGVVTWANAKSFPKRKFSHIYSKFVNGGSTSLTVRFCETGSSTVHRNSWTFEEEFKREIDKAMCRLYTDTG